MFTKEIKILMAAAEIAPFAKVGGLADVVGSLPWALKKLHCQVKLIMPLYGSIDRRKFKLKKIIAGLEMESAGKRQKINLWRTSRQGIEIYFIEHNKFFGRAEVYSGDDAARFLFFSLACLRVLSLIKFKPDIIHCHDFHTALIPNLIKAGACPDHDFYQDIKILFTIHNLNHQGRSGIEVLSTGNLDEYSLKSLTRDARDHDINFMVQGIINADLVNTVSPTYAREITTSVYGASLERIVRENKDKISGILNGLDLDFFNPAKDKYIFSCYGLKTLERKTDNKVKLQKQLSLPVSRKTALVGFISRLAWQKGLELITDKLVENCDCQFVFLGTGEKKYETELKKLARRYPAKVSAQIIFDIKLAQRIYAAADIFLMPSRFEPCGLGQMIAMRYGAVPLVHATGGLADTVNSKVGFSFKNFSERELDKTLKQALDIYYNRPRQWKKLQKAGMKKDFSAPAS